MQIGIDIGGTFTDLVLLAEQGVTVLKVPSTPANPTASAVEGLRQLRDEYGVDLSQVELICHGTTVATNTLIERTGARTALITTAGFRDLLEIGEMKRHAEALYNIQYQRPEPLIPRARIFEVAERVTVGGQVLQPLDRGAVQALGARLRELEVEAVAVCLLFSFAFPDHEQAVREILQAELPDAVFYLSSEICPVIHEYRRLTTTCISAYVGPKVRQYLNRMRTSLAEFGADDRLYIMQSNGGITSPALAWDAPGTLVLSGPAGGVTYCHHLGESLGLPNLLSFDMGGTSCDVSMVHGSQPVETTGKRVEGLPLHLPSIDIVTIGAGGGSLAWVDEGGALRVGPRSAGADPGPVCYGRGGTQPTVTDINLLGGVLNPERRLGGKVALNAELARQALREKIATPLGLAPEEAVAGIMRIVNNHMAVATRMVSVNQGLDPRDFALVAFGGGGPCHVTYVAEELGIPWVVVPAYPGLTSAYGLIIAGVKHDISRTWMRPMATLDPADLAAVLGEMEAHGREAVTRIGVAPESLQFQRTIEMRYTGQNYNIDVPLAEAAPDRTALDRLVESFHQQHFTLYGFQVPTAAVEIVNLRVRTLAPPAVAHGGPGGPGGAFDTRTATPAATRPGLTPTGEQVTYGIYNRDRLAAGDVITGPAIVEQTDTTTVVPGGWLGTVEPGGNILIGKEVWRGGNR